MTLRLSKGDEAAAESAKAAAQTQTQIQGTAPAGSSAAAASPSIPNEPPPSYQDVIAELPASSTSPRVLNRADSDPESDSDGINTPQEGARAGYIPGDHKHQPDAQLEQGISQQQTAQQQNPEQQDTQQHLETDLPQPLQGTLSPVIQTKVDTLLGALEAYRSGSGRRLPVKRARRDLLNQLYDDQIRNQENATGTRLRAREKAAIWKDLSGLRDDMWHMVREAKRARRQWA